MAEKLQLSPEIEAYVRWHAGVAPAQSNDPVYKRILKNKWTWLSIVIIASSIASLLIMANTVMPNVTTEDGFFIPGLNANAVSTSAWRALPTLIFWIVCFVLVDRFKPQRLWMWFLAVLWGGSVATCASMFLNTWLGEQMAVIDDMAGLLAAREAVFVAPFVEEGFKACIIFLIVIVDRNRFTSRVSGAVIGGLAAAGFAFTENILYYARVIVFVSYNAGAGEAQERLDYIVYLRGVLTAFGHPLFTIMTGIGIGFAVTARSKSVRVLAPVAGYLMAALLHMFFNFQASILPEEQLFPLVLMIAWPVVIMVAVRLVVSSIRQGRVISARLDDYASVGWLPPEYSSAFSRLRSRAWTVIMSIWHGSVIKTWKLQARVTELATLGEAISRGTIDRGALLREYDLINEIKELDTNGGLYSGKGLRPYWPWNASLHAYDRHRNAHSLEHIATTQVPLKYSAVDPSWSPPT
ncbi:MAG: PrsW family intramembrane metalloprotease [Propionibacteriaceae bacterium]|nr:PrsW family intramembrane metalloprotease [Propionibacteriaceae bacterium]